MAIKYLQSDTNVKTDKGWVPGKPMPPAPGKKLSGKAGLAEIESMQKAGELAPIDPYDIEERRRQVWELHLKRISMHVIAKFFGIAVSTVHSDVRVKLKEAMADLSAHGAGGMLTKSFSTYEYLQADLMSKIDDLKEGSKTEEYVSLVRMVKDIEDSKARLLLSIGALTQKQSERPKLSDLNQSSTVKVLETDSVRNVLMGVLQKVKGSINAGTVIEG